MPAATESLLYIESLHYAVDYIPKRALRYFTAPENRPEAVPLLLEEAQDVIDHPAEYLEEGSKFLFHALMILGSFQEEKAIALIRKIGLMDHEAIDEMLGDRLFDSVSLAIAEIFAHQIPRLKELIVDAEIDPCIRATCLQSIMFLYGRCAITRAEVVGFFIDLMNKPEDNLPFFYEVIAAASLALHPEEMLPGLKKLYADSKIDLSQIKLEEIEEILSLPKEDVITEGLASLNAQLEDPISHLEGIEEIAQAIGYERNDSCPCGSQIKFKKCCY